MIEIVASWYGVLSGPSRAFAIPLQQLADAIQIPALSALVLGLLGALSPCQLSTGLGAVALIGRRAEGTTLLAGGAFVVGKALVYLLLGVAFVGFGQAAAQSSIPVIQVVRRALGPLMVLAGLVLLGVVRSRVGLGAGNRLAALASARLDATRPAGAFLLGGAFAFAFCPTLFLLFFGLLIPLALASAGGVVFPALFAAGTALPVLAVLAALALGRSSARSLALSAQPYLTKVAGAVLLLTGLNDTIVYWFV